MPQKVSEVQNTNTYQMVINLTGKQNEAIQENYNGYKMKPFKKQDSKKQIHSPIAQAQNIPNHGHDC